MQKQIQKAEEQAKIEEMYGQRIQAAGKNSRKIDGELKKVEEA